ncbi:MAG: ABC transporter permease [Verrucomicrobiota bacterium]
MTAVALETVDLRKEYQLGGETVVALRDVSLKVERGDYVAIMGPSGSGKTTLLNLLGALDQPSSGHYYIAGVDVATLDDNALSRMRGQHIGFVFQAYNLIPQLNVIENVESPLGYRGGGSPEERERCRQLIQDVGLGKRFDHRPNELSGGQQQRAAIARSLANGPDFILADEATGNLDSKTTEEILALFDQLNDSGATIVMVTHEDHVAQRARRIVRLLDGEIESDERHREIPQQSSTPNQSTTSSSSTHRSLPALFRLRDLRVGFKSLLAHPLRSLLTVLGIFVGVASVIWLLAIGEGISQKSQAQIQELGADNIILTSTPPPSEELRGRRVAAYGLTEEDTKMLRNSIPSVEMAIHFARRTGHQIRYRDQLARTEINGCAPDYKELYSLELARGRFLTEADGAAKAKVCVLSQELVDEVFRHEDPIGRSVRIYREYFRVVGVIKSRTEVESIRGTVRGQDFSDNSYIPLETFWSVYGDYYTTGNNGARGVSQITLRLHDRQDAIATGTAVTDALERSHLFTDFTVGVPMELLNQARNTKLMFMGMMGMIAAISLVVGGIGIMNIMLASVTERTREIGIRRALGARRRDINRQFLIETILLSVGGGISGILGGLTCGSLIATLFWLIGILFPEMLTAMPETVRDIEPIILPWSIPLAFGISVAVGVIFGLYPARRAAAMNPIDALRHIS